MYIEDIAADNHTAINAALSTSALILGSYSLYTLLNKSSYGFYGSWQQNKMIVSTIAKITPISFASSVVCAGVWGLVDGRSIDNSSGGIAALTFAYTVPVAFRTFCLLDYSRLYDDSWVISKSIATSLSIACAVSIVKSDNAQLSNPEFATLAVTSTFPVALTFFNYRAVNTLEEDDTVVAKAVSASVAVAGAVSLISVISPGNKM